mgnify:CR=1 FL=1
MDNKTETHESDVEITTEETIESGETKGEAADTK